MLYLKVDVELNEEKCSSCEHKFSCWSDTGRRLEAQEFEIESSIDRDSHFRALFDISDLCIRIESRSLLGNSNCIEGFHKRYFIDSCNLGFMEGRTKIEIAGTVRGTV